MFRIDTGQARTDLYKADPLDFSNLQQAMSENKRMAYQEKQAKLKAQEERDADLYANMAKMDQMAIMPKDQANFALEAEAVRDYVRKNHDALVKNGDVNARMKFQELIGNYTQKAKLSADAQTQYNQVIADYGKNKDKYTRGTEEYLRDMGSTKTAGQWVIDPSQIVQRIDLQQKVLDELVPYAQDKAKKDIGKTTFTIGESRSIVRDYFKDKARHRQLVEDFDEAEDKLGATDPDSYAENLYAPQLTVNDRSPIPEYYMGDSNKPKFPNVSTVINRNKTTGETVATFEFTDKSKNLPVVVDDPKNKGKSIEVIPRGLRGTPDGKIYLQASTLPHGEGDDRVEGENIDLDYRYASEIMKNRFGIDNPVSFLGGESVPEHVTMKERETKQDRKVVKTGKTKDGKTVVKYSDGSIEYK